MTAFSRWFSRSSLSLALIFCASSVALGELSISDGPSYDFGSRVLGNSFPVKTYIVSNVGLQKASLTKLSPSTPFVWASPTGGVPACGLQLNAFSSCSVGVSLNPTRVGTFSENLEIQFKAGRSSGTLRRSLRATVVHRPLDAVTLRQLASHETAFFAEYNSYWPYVDALGFEPSSEALSRYMIGFSQLSPNMSPMTLNLILTVFPSANRGPLHTTSPWVSEASFQQAAAKFCPSGICSADERGFTGIAVGNLDDDPFLDVWLIDSEQFIYRASNDVTNTEATMPLSPEPEDPKDLQAGAVVAMAGFRTVEESFYAEYGEYTTYVRGMGFDPGSRLGRVYDFGFNRSLTPSDYILSVFPALVLGPIHTAPAERQERLLRAAQMYCPGGVCTASQTTYTAIIVGNLDADATLDVWLLNESGNRTHVSDDLLK